MTQLPGAACVMVTYGQSGMKIWCIVQCACGRVESALPYHVEHHSPSIADGTHKVVVHKSVHRKANGDERSNVLRSQNKPGSICA